MLFLLLVLLSGGAYVAYSLNLLGPMMQMSSAAWGQGVDIGKQKLREFLENNETARAAIAMPARRDTDSISLDTLDSRGNKAERRANGGSVDNDDDEI